MDIIRVVCGVIYFEEKIFLCRRKAHKSLSGYWEFPGGKIESGEDEKTSLTRELAEELGMSVIIGNHFKTVEHQYEGFKIELIAYTCTYVKASFVMTDHDKYEWLKPQEIPSYLLAPADIPIAKALLIEP